MRWLGSLLLVIGLLSGCGMKSFSDAYAVRVDSPQAVSIFDSMMGQSADWAEKTMGQAAPGAPYTTELGRTEAKMVFDGSPPSSIRAGLYLPEVTDTGYYSIVVNEVSAGTLSYEAPFVAWYSDTPVDPKPALPLTLEIAEGGNGWVVNVMPEAGP
jgi:hypothetical protein